MMIIKLIYFEIKNILRDRLMIFILFYPLLIAFVGRYLMTLDDFNQMGVEIITVVAVVISGMLFGAIAGFSILDDRDDHIFVSIAISPLSLRLYIWVKIVFIYLMSLVSSAIIYTLIGISSLSWAQVIILAIISGLQVPLHALIINAFSTNKVEGFVMMKATGFLIVFPIIGYFFVDAKQWLFAFAPAFWVTKATQSVLMKPQIDAGLIDLGLNFWGFIGIGCVYFVVLIVLAIIKFNRKIFQ
jgi:fluoroquinolone transport system permease protein